MPCIGQRFSCNCFTMFNCLQCLKCKNPRTICKRSLNHFQTDCVYLNFLPQSWNSLRVWACRGLCDILSAWVISTMIKFRLIHILRATIHQHKQTVFILNRLTLSMGGTWVHIIKSSYTSGSQQSQCCDPLDDFSKVGATPQ